MHRSELRLIGPSVAAINAAETDLSAAFEVSLRRDSMASDSNGLYIRKRGGELISEHVRTYKLIGECDFRQSRAHWFANKHNPNAIRIFLSKELSDDSSNIANVPYEKLLVSMGLVFEQQAGHQEIGDALMYMRERVCNVFKNHLSEPEVDMFLRQYPKESFANRYILELLVPAERVAQLPSAICSTIPIIQNWPNCMAFCQSNGDPKQLQTFLLQ